MHAGVDPLGSIILVIIFKRTFFIVIFDRAVQRDKWNNTFGS
jgi:hypothetical protein